MIQQEDLGQARQEISEQLRKSDPVCASILAEARWDATESSIELRVDSSFAREQLEKRGAIRKMLADYFPGLTVKIIHDPEVAACSQETLPGFEAAEVTLNGSRTTVPLLEFTFNQFVVGDSNRVAHALAVAVAQGAWRKPVLLVGGTGCGKTHLLKAAAKLFSNTGASVEFNTAEGFGNDYGAALRGNGDSTMSCFRSRYRDAGLLVLDEVHFFSGKEGFVKAFLLMFKHREERQAPMLLSSSLPLNKLELPDDLRRRLEVAHCPIDLPDNDTRTEIVMQMAKRLGLEFKQEWAALVVRQTKSVGQIENRVNRVNLCVTRLGRTLDDKLVEELFPEKPADISEATTEEIMQETAAHFGITVRDIKSRDRSPRMSIPRHIGMFISRESLGESLAKIGKTFGGFDHTTVRHACGRIDLARKGLAKAPGRRREYILDKSEVDGAIAAIVGAVASRHR